MSREHALLAEASRNKEHADEEDTMCRSVAPTLGAILAGVCFRGVDAHAKSPGGAE